jgi:hypothetical protein
MPHIFELFTQIPSERVNTGGGLGIGLALVRALVELHGGDIGVASKGLDRGSEFTLRLPLFLEKAVAANGAETAGETAPVVQVRRNILIADDNQDALESLALARGQNLRTALVDNLHILIELAWAVGEDKIPARMSGALESAREEMNYPLPPVEQEKYAQMQAALRQSLGAAVYDAEMTEGKRLSLEEAMACVEATLASRLL